MGILGTILLQLPSDYSPENAEENAIIKTIVQSRVCFVDGLAPDQDVAATKLLDAGVHVV